MKPDDLKKLLQTTANKAVKEFAEQLIKSHLLEDLTYGNYIVISPEELRDFAKEMLEDENN